jgi:hypothetical protein
MSGGGRCFLLFSQLALRAAYDLHVAARQQLISRTFWPIRNLDAPANRKLVFHVVEES